jgi:hypothetical protein
MLLENKIWLRSYETSAHRIAAPTLLPAKAIEE